eukprot:CAMPEP_0177592048 /NCGR_PEP_ID=MMETSP0419_2-20121207/8341_1 /TAXON_ID=582737 /ORGANISM="Tetraselmis sp., Strain GSL018" /LENGTH=147 /DNA_ID=CAMNT_0019082867 /DNA_START=333 /DNA_END=776 /DNA_ORIENTATION=-
MEVKTGRPTEGGTWRRLLGRGGALAHGVRNACGDEAARGSHLRAALAPARRGGGVLGGGRGRALAMGQGVASAPLCTGDAGATDGLRAVTGSAAGGPRIAHNQQLRLEHRHGAAMAEESRANRVAGIRPRARSVAEGVSVLSSQRLC